MFKNKKLRLTSIALTVAMVFSLLCTAVPASAVTDSITDSGASGKSRVVTTVAPSIFSATVPYVLPISIDADQNVYTADNAAITNNSNGPVKVESVEITANDGWELVDASTDFNAVPVNSKQFTLEIQNVPLETSGVIEGEAFESISGNDILKIDYTADAAVQSEAISNENIANALITVEWDSVEINCATVSKTALNSFAKTVTTFQKTPERLNLDDVKATQGVVKIDDGTTEKSIYAWSDENGNGYWWTDAMIAYLPEDSSGLFYNCSKLTSLDLQGLDSSNVTNMSNMFSRCLKLTLIDLSPLDTRNVTDMSWMFSYLKLTKIDLSPLDTRNVTNISNMFYQTSLTIIDLSPLDMCNVTNARSMFYGCTKLTLIKLPSLNTGNLTDIDNMFHDCISLTTIDLSPLDTRNVTNMSNMFNNCRELISLDLSPLDTSNVTNTSYMFTSTIKLKLLDLSSFDICNVTNTNNMFYGCNNLKTIYVSDYNTDKVTSSSSMFSGCVNLVGQNGTAYDSNFVDKTYARIDNAPDEPGYFTYKAKAA